MGKRRDKITFGVVDAATPLRVANEIKNYPFRQKAISHVKTGQTIKSGRPGRRETVGIIHLQGVKNEITSAKREVNLLRAGEVPNYARTLSFSIIPRVIRFN